MMRGTIGTFLLAGWLAACTVAPTPDGAPVADAVGTPFLIAFKVPVCLATVVLGAPLAGATGLAPNPQSLEIRREIDDGLNQNCGPPYTLGAP